MNFYFIFDLVPQNGVVCEFVHNIPTMNFTLSTGHPALILFTDGMHFSESWRIFLFICLSLRHSPIWLCNAIDASLSSQPHGNYFQIIFSLQCTLCIVHSFGTPPSWSIEEEKTIKRKQRERHSKYASQLSCLPARLKMLKMSTKHLDWQAFGAQIPFFICVMSFSVFNILLC